MPDKIDSNITSAAFAEEATIGVLPGSPVWYRVEPNSFAETGGDVTTVARAPINPSRQRRKGTIVDLDSSYGMNHDFVMTGLMRALQGFFFAAARENADSQSLAIAPIALTATTVTTYTAAAGLGAFKATDIVFASGFATAANNGIRVLSAASATTLTTTGLTVEAAPPAAARVQTVGTQFASADVNVANVTAANFALTCTAFDFTTLGLTPGEWIYLGDDIAGNRFANNLGYARVLSAAAKVIVLDQSTWTPVNEVGTGKTIRMYYGTVLRNEKTPSLIVRKSVQWERQLGNDGNGTQSEYVTGAVANEMSLNVPMTDKMNVDLGYIGIGNEQRTGTTGVKAGTRVEPPLEGAVNTSTDVVRNRLAIVDPTTMNNTGLVGYCQEITLTINNGVTPNKAIGKLGAFDATAADFAVDGELTAYFSDIRAVQAIRQVADVGWNYIAARANKGFIWDLPLLTLGGGRVNVEKDSAITIPVTEMGAENALGYTLMYVEFPYLPTVAMPVQ